jgi:lysophospholipase L1-like esterase
LMIGTNNTKDRPGMKANSPEEVADGITAIVKQIETKCPGTKVLLLGIFPRTEAADSPDRTTIKTINNIIAKLDDGKMVRYLDIGAKFLDPDGTLPKSIMPDSLHPNEKGYQIWADAILPTVKEMMK